MRATARLPTRGADSGAFNFGCAAAVDVGLLFATEYGFAKEVVAVLAERLCAYTPVKFRCVPPLGSWLPQSSRQASQATCGQPGLV